MKIAQITFSMCAGGAETLVKQLSIEMKQRGHDVTTVLLDRVRDSYFEKDAIKTLRDSNVRLVTLDRGRGLTENLVSFLQLRKRLLQGDFDIVHSHGGLLDAMSVLGRFLTPVKSQLVFTIHNSKYESRGLAPALIRLCRRKGQVVYCSKAAFEANLREGFENVKYIENGIRFDPPVLKNHSADHGNDDSVLDLTHEGIKLLAVGRLCEQKNHGFMLRVVKWLRENSKQHVTLEIAGSGDPSNLRDFATKLGIGSQVHFLGVRTDVPALLAEADIFISTSLWEGLPLTVLEAFNSGISCVLSPIPEHLDIGQDVESCCFPSDLSPQAMGEAVIEAHRRLRSKARVRAERQAVLDRYSIQRCADDYLELFQELTTRG